MLQEACEAVDVLGKHYVPSKSAMPQDKLQELKEYFRRPRVVSTGTIPFGSRARHATVDVTSSTLFTTLFPFGSVRLMGVQGVRFKLVATLQVATTPFHQGVLALSWQYSVASGETIQFVRSKFSSTATNLPHVRLDMSTDTMVQLHIPFLNTVEYHEIFSPYFNVYGVLSLNSLLPTASFTGGVEPTYKILLHLEDLELIGTYPGALSVVNLQAGQKLSPIEKEQYDDAKPFSSALSAASKTMGFIAKGVPSLSSVAGPASWALESAAGATRSFGYSKPQSQDPVMRTQINPSISEHSVDLPSSTYLLGPLASNHLEVTPEFAGTDVDEMSLAFLTSQWGQTLVGTITTDNTTSTPVYGCQVTPAAMWFRRPAVQPYGNFLPYLSNASNTANSFLPTSLMYWSTFFKFWRGDIEFRFTFAKTKLHGGRVLVSYIPGTAAATNNTNISGPEISGGTPQPFGHSAIFDLRDGNVFTFTAPYSSPFPYLRYGESTGSLVMSILDPLQATGVVANNISFMVEARGKSNFELANVVGPIYPAHAQGTPVFQSGQILPTTVGELSRTAIGEKIQSAKQLIMMPKNIVFTQAGNSTITYTPPPWFWQPTYPTDSPGPAPGSLVPESFGFGGNIATCYTFVRGSTDYHVYTDLNQLTQITAAPYSVINNDPTAPITTAQDLGPAMNKPRLYGLNTVHFRLPAYQGMNRRISWDMNTTAWDPSSATKRSPAWPFRLSQPAIRVQNRQTGAVTINMSRAAGDDAMLGHYIGPCPLLLCSANPTPSTYDPDSVGFQ